MESSLSQSSPLRLSHPMSLSMKLRAESTRPVTSLSLPENGFGISTGIRGQNLPRISKSRSTKLTTAGAGAGGGGPRSDVGKIYERLSCSFQTEGYETFPNRETISHPSTLCVKCASHASLCVPCADSLAQDSVEFFRRSQALGAYHLFSGAIKQAGGEKVLRFVIFRIWKNSVLLRRFGRTQRSGQTAKRYNDLILRDPFRAWVKFTKECQNDRRDKREQQYEERIQVLEQQVNKYATEKLNSDKQVRRKFLTYSISPVK
jgi:hypothetical protein